MTPQPSAPLRLCGKKRSLPKNISLKDGGCEVRVTRGKVTYRAYVPGQSPQSLLLAIEKRDRFVAIHGAVKIPKVRPVRVRALSNTGIAGISETVKWVYSHPRPCFAVSWSTAGRQHIRCVYIHAGRPRAQAFREAVALRKLKEPRAVIPEEVTCL
jgi:hypothetical protein